jgi:hypothetical protein
VFNAPFRIAGGRPSDLSNASEVRHGKSPCPPESPSPRCQRALANGQPNPRYPHIHRRSRPSPEVRFRVICLVPKVFGLPNPRSGAPAEIIAYAVAMFRLDPDRSTMARAAKSVTACRRHGPSRWNHLSRLEDHQRRQRVVLWRHAVGFPTPTARWRPSPTARNRLTFSSENQQS